MNIIGKTILTSKTFWVNFLAIIFFIVQIGVYPKPFLSRMDASVKHLVAQVELKTGKRSIKKDKMAYVVDSDKIRQEH